MRISSLAEDCIVSKVVLDLFWFSMLQIKIPKECVLHCVVIWDLSVSWGRGELLEDAQNSKQLVKESSKQGPDHRIFL